MAISKVIFKASAEATPEVWMDTTDKTVDSGNMLNGITALKNDGTTVTGNLASKSASDMTVSGATVTAPAGVYSAAASKSVASGSATTPATTVTANPSISVSSGGLIAATASATKSVTPTVSAGYVSNGTAGTITVSGSNTSQLTTQAAQTLYPSTSDQTISSGKYLTGTQTVKGVLLTNLDAGNIKKDVVVKVGDSADDDRITSVTGTYEGSGGGGTVAEQKDVNFIDFDGAILYSYTAAEFANLSALPANPSHTGLTAQGWNWSLSDAKTYVATYGKLWIGQMYVTSDGKTRIYIRLEEGRLSPYLGIAVNGTATVEWGDGSSDSTITGTSTSTVINTQHNYSAAGDYVIAISVSGSMALVGGSYGSQVLWTNSTPANENRVYQNAIQKVEIGSNAEIKESAFYNCNSLASITIPSGTSICFTNTFYYCYSLASITTPSGTSYSNGIDGFAYCYHLRNIAIPSGVTIIGPYAFRSCYTLVDITIPSNVTSIGAYAFYYCYSLASITIPINVNTIDVYAFQYCHSLANVTILADLYRFYTYTFASCFSLANITIPMNVWKIDNHAFYYCYGLGEIHFIPTTPPTVENSNAWTSLPADCIIYVPYSADHSVLAAYQSANNYPSSSTYTYMEE